MAKASQDRAISYILRFGFLVIVLFAVSMYLRGSADRQKAADQNQADTALLQTVGQNAPVGGASDPNAIRIVEFGDFQCPTCKEASAVVSQVMAKHPGKIQRVWIHAFSTETHQEAENAAIAAQCAHRQGRFWDFHDLLFQQQDALSALLYNQIAQTLKLNVDQFRACLGDTAVRDIVRADQEFATRQGVTSVPYILVNDTPVEGDITLDKIEALVKQ